MKSATAALPHNTNDHKQSCFSLLFHIYCTEFKDKISRYDNQHQTNMTWHLTLWKVKLKFENSGIFTQMFRPLSERYFRIIRRWEWTIFTFSLAAIRSELQNRFAKFVETFSSSYFWLECNSNLHSFHCACTHRCIIYIRIGFIISIRDGVDGNFFRTGLTKIFLATVQQSTASQFTRIY